MSSLSLLAAGALLFAADASNHEIRDQTQTIFEDTDYNYCHDENLALFPLDKEYCEVVTKPNRLCPALPEVCENELSADVKWIPKGRMRYGREGKDYGDQQHRPGEDGGSGDGNGHGSGAGDGSGNGSGNGSGDGNGNGASGHGGKGGKGGTGGGDKGSSGKGGNRDTKPKNPDTDPGKPENKPEKPPPPPPPPPEPIELPEWVAMVMRVLFYVLAAAFIGGIVYFIVKNLMKGKEEVDDGDEKKVAEETPEETPQAPRGPVETDVDRLLNRARAAAERGDYKQAIDDAYAALLRRLEGDGVIDLHPSRTNGDYVRSIRDRAELRSAVKGIATDVERVQFGSEAPSHPLFDSIYRRVLPLVGRAALLALLFFGAATQASCDATPVPPAALSARGSHTLAALLGSEKRGGANPTGLQAVIALLEKNDLDVTIEHPKDDELGDKKVVVILPGTALDKDSWKALRRWMKNQGGVVVMFGWREPLLEDFGIGYDAVGENADVVPGPMSPMLQGELRLKLPHVGKLVVPPAPVGSAYRYATPPVTVLLQRVPAGIAEPEPYAAEVNDPAKVGSGKLVVFADDRLFANIALALGDNASYLVQFFKRLPSDELQIWDDRNGGGGGGSSGGADGESAQGEGEGEGGPGNPVDSLARAHLLPIILQLIALVLLYLLYRGTRFGTPKDPKEQSRRAFADHARALGLTYARGKAARFVTGLYAVWALDRLRERLLPGRRKGLTPLAEAIAARTGRPIGEVMQVLMEATGARDEVAPPSSFRSFDPNDAARAQQQQQRPFWVMEQLEYYLAATKPQKTTRGKTAHAPQATRNAR